MSQQVSSEPLTGKKLDAFLERGPEFYSRLREEVGKAFIGLETPGVRSVFHSMVITHLSGGNAIITGVPGLGKTELIKGYARAVATPFCRVTCVPDLLPGDILGSFDPKYDPPQFMPGALRAEAGVALWNEFNRLMPKSMSAALEAWEERQFTVENHTFVRNRIAVDFADQNPLETGETSEIVEAGWDRLMFKLRMSYLPEDEEDMLAENAADLMTRRAFNAIQPVTNEDEIVYLRDQIQKTIYLDPKLRRYMLRVVRMTRNPQFKEVEVEGEKIAMKTRKGNSVIRAGASPRGTIWLVMGSKVRAWLDGRKEVLPGDPVDLFESILAHRIFLAKDTAIGRKSGLAEAIVRTAAAVVPLPRPGD